MVTSAFALRPAAGSGAAAAPGRRSSRSLALARHMEQLDEAGESAATRASPRASPTSRVRHIRCPTPLPLVARVESFDAGGHAERSERPGQQARRRSGSGCRSSAGRPSGKAHARCGRPCAWALSSVPAPRSATSAEIVERVRQPHSRSAFDGFGIGAIVVAEQLDADRDRRLPGELRIIARAVREARRDVEQRMGERRLITGISRRRAAAAAGGGRRASCDRGAPSRGRSASVPGGVVRRR